MRAMLLEDDSQYNPDAWDLNKQYYYGDWFLVAPASATTDTVVSVWLPAAHHLVQLLYWRAL
ncbi:hypothetical protein [Anaeromassilibacillus sp. SJQ-1]|uniref:hypothetical protein n=1 Tax=Anaeromassilibacillus sp. SJQ-1 TaxID=3375419 RepID=UPI00398A1880